MNTATFKNGAYMVQLHGKQGIIAGKVSRQALKHYAVVQAPVGLPGLYQKVWPYLVNKI